MTERELPCDRCLRRTWLLAALAGRIEVAWRSRHRPAALLAIEDDETLVHTVGGPGLGALRAKAARFDPATERERVRAAGLTAICRHDPRYPVRLAELDEAPATLHLAGSAETLASLAAAPAVAIVGARRATAHGREVAHSLARGLAASGVTVVSGMALGIDAAAHGGALAAGARTMAVLAGGAERAYPASKHRLHRALVERAAVISEHPPGFRAFRWCFPARNRIIAGLADLTVVVEAAARSGSLITAGLARDAGRDVGAVPGPVTSLLAAGTNGLLFDGAQMIRDAQDALDVVLGAGATTAPSPAQLERSRLTPDLAAVLDAIEHGRDTTAALVAGEAEVHRTLAALGDLEFRGLVRRAAGGRYVLVA